MIAYQRRFPHHHHHHHHGPRDAAGPLHIQQVLNPHVGPNAMHFPPPLPPPPPVPAMLPMPPPLPAHLALPAQGPPGGPAAPPVDDRHMLHRMGELLQLREAERQRHRIIRRREQQALELYR